MSNVLAPFQLLELNVISAQDLAPVTRNMRTYAVAWVHPDRKLSTRVDTQGHTNPTWNDKFVFRVDEEFLYADTSAIMIEIYALHWFKDVHVGTVRVLVGNLIPPPPDRPYHNNRAPLGMRFVALQVRRASGRPQGILNIGVAVLDSSMRSMPLYTLNSSAVGYRHLMGEKDAYDSHNHLSPHVFNDSNSRRTSNANRSSSAAPIKPELRRTKSDTSSMMGSEAVVARRSIANKGRANSAISESVVSGASSLPEVEQHEEDETRKKKNKGRRSRGNSVTSEDSPEKAKSVKSKSILSGSLPWRLKKNRNEDSASMMTESEILHIQEPPPPNFEGGDNAFMHHHQHQHQQQHHNNLMEHGHAKEYNHSHRNENNANNHYPNNNEAMYANHHDDDDVASSVNTIHDDDDIRHDGHVISNNTHHHEAPPAASRKPEYMPPPPPQFHNSPAAQFHASPAPQFHASPAPKFRNSPAPKYMSSPVVEPQIKNSSAPYYINSPKPQYMNSPKPQYQSSPAHQFWNSPKPQFHSSPAPQFRNSPAPQFHNSPKPQFHSSPAPQFRNSPAILPKQYRPSPAPQYRASPGRFHPMSNRATPMHPFGYTPRFEYTTPRRSNLGNFGPPVVTESELGPSASEVAAEMARNPRVDEEGASTVGGWSLDESVEGLESKLDRWRTELPPVADRGDFSSFPATSTSKTPSRRSRRNTDSGLFSCFSTICGVECGISCGSDPKGKKKNQRHGVARSSASADETSFL
ncbi:uncharacterized protein LOC130950009 [Arachis stenosperma]|uniref:uncharacterized protein LOC130950009 n=1 Tax=Arachis stenosperma TaxID=217475 RepID=UPI0025AD913C|nr:uncharacterized protein LOC130950009 [Arachis stenosperma]